MKIGNRVKFRKNLVPDNVYGRLYAYQSMLRELETINYQGTIEKVCSNDNFRIKGSHWVFNSEMLEPEPTEGQDVIASEMLAMLKDILEDMETDDVEKVNIHPSTIRNLIAKIEGTEHE